MRKLKQTKLLEFNNMHGETLRGIITFSAYTNPKGVIMMGGFERSAASERKFKALSDALVEIGIPSFRFDHAGMGISDGDFSRLSVPELCDAFIRGVKAAKKKVRINKVSFFGHSLPPCIISSEKIRKLLDKAIMSAPALNQRDLLRYWFVKNEMKKTNPKKKISWENYKDYLDEKEFKAYCAKDMKITKTTFAGSEYFIDSSNRDYSELVPDAPNILHIHGEKDEVVPLASLKKKFSNTVIIEGGDHDNERPDLLKHWKQAVVHFVEN